MNNDEPKPEADDAPEGADDRSEASTPPRGNPETDHESVQKGEDQLGRISGN